jgi:hypothetical protein
LRERFFLLFVVDLFSSAFFSFPFPLVVTPKRFSNIPSNQLFGFSLLSSFSIGVVFLFCCSVFFGPKNDSQNQLFFVEG